MRLDDKLKSKACAVLDELDVSPTEAVRLLFQYIAENERLPLKALTVSDEKDALLKTVRERLASLQKGIKVTLDKL
ncbi:type II toxin-antitoxin system RelB/DinJ family antitoxin [Erwinia amylovora]|uniref:Antitoxin RelB n=4 Tax=Erwinia amylovora TaxID=552 RepID=A0A831A410_ERWAM|nr:type II toxin-antitoxin system RelB/DinJ family antitoxin [Erwinia amylovora]CBX81661.1 Antitoxin RelB [Erwinia amylovora ATCC BAA-2158]CDK16164.1 Antitoxin RelB [Erwinia amylovora LA635]CDK19530.1 Antitoxin RelB [Erwinia amylovora LA636]CDK22902.1 Antitoxin RelB [Erwinia amylovora LA637]ATZ10707.1 type II toxin-antitoxin system RelB/DinJ family antitoxin [Erwinia amylovora]